jgi:lysyl-tRNA synthetase class 2
VSADQIGGGWRPSAQPEVLAARARMLACIRAFFAERAVMEVETPILSRHAVTDPALQSLRIEPGGTGAARWLHTSPEFPMKRLLAAGSGPIYQVCKVFRDDERGRRHHPEFTLLEWYRPGFTLHALMDEVAALVRDVIDHLGHRLKLADERIGYRDLFRSRLGLDPWSASLAARRTAAIGLGVPGAEQLDLDADGWLDLLLSHCLEPDLGRDGMTFVYDYPPSQAALARIRGGTFPAAERFELYIDGMELANGFQELTDAAEQRQRFEQDLEHRRDRNLAPVPMDTELLDALAAGMPETAGVALGLDRLMMVAIGAAHIDQVLTFPVERA